MGYSISVIGDRESLLAFRTLGFDVYECNTRREALKALKKSAENCAIIYVTEKIYRLIDAEIKEYDDKTVPAIIPFPGTSGSEGLGIELLNKSVEAAVGSNILQN